MDRETMKYIIILETLLIVIMSLIIGFCISNNIKIKHDKDKEIEELQTEITQLKDYYNSKYKQK